MTGLRQLVLGLAGTLATIVLAAGTLTTAPTALAGNGVCPENPHPPDAADPAIIVDRPANGAAVTSPIAVEGKARVFEATVSIELYDAQGNVIAEGFTNAAAGAPELAPFSTTLPFAVSETQGGCLRVFEASAKDGSPTNVVQVEVTLEAASAAPTPQAPETGSGSVDNSGTGSLATTGAVVILLLAGIAGGYGLSRGLRA